MPSISLKPEDILVQIRDKELARVGSVPLEDLNIKMQPVFNGVGSWLVSLPAEHREVKKLRTPGYGIVVTNLRTGKTLLSGPTSKPSKRATNADARGMVTIAGLTDDCLLWQARSLPSPSEPDPAAQTAANDVRSGVASTIMRQYVNVNIGPGAPIERRGSSLRNAIVLAADPVLGGTTKRSPRFDVLGELLKGIAQEQGLGFRLIQVGTDLEFQIYQPHDRSDIIRLDVQNGTLQEQSVETAPPEVTRMWVAGQGKGVGRKVVEYTTADSEDAEDLWGLIIEEFKDQRNTDDDTELEASGMERLNDAGFTKVAVKAIPANDQTMIFMTDFDLGDRIGVVIDGQEQPVTTITEAAIVVNENGLKTAIAIGDIADFDSESALRQTVSDTQRRVESLERNAEATSAPGSYPETGDVKATLRTSSDGWLLMDGSTFDESEYPDLYDFLGTNTLPDWREHTVAGYKSGSAEFGTLGGKYGEKEHTLTAAEGPMHSHLFGADDQIALAGFALQSNFGYDATSTSSGAGGRFYTSQMFDASNGGSSISGGSPHNNIQPTVAVNWMIKT